MPAGPGEAGQGPRETSCTLGQQVSSQVEHPSSQKGSLQFFPELSKFSLPVGRRGARSVILTPVALQAAKGSDLSFVAFWTWRAACT